MENILPRGRKPKQSSASDEFAIALEHLKKGFELLTSTQAMSESAQPAQKANGGKSTKPAEGEAAFALYELLEKSKRPVAVEVIAKKVGKSVQSVRLYLSKYDCFENVWGKGYRLR